MKPLFLAASLMVIGPTKGAILALAKVSIQIFKTTSPLARGTEMASLLLIIALATVFLGEIGA